MEFKGTKKFPEYHGGDNYSIDLVFDNESVISIDRRSRYSDDVVVSREEMEANAKLISKAPEMLDQLKECLEFLQKVQSPATQALFLSQSIRNLIKEATTI